MKMYELRVTFNGSRHRVASTYFDITKEEALDNLRAEARKLCVEGYDILKGPANTLVVSSKETSEYYIVYLNYYEDDIPF